MSFSLSTNSEAFLTKQLYKAFNLEDPARHFEYIQKLQKKSFEKGWITEAAYQECIRQKRRTGKTTNLIISAITSWLQGEHVIFRAFSYLALDILKQELEKLLPGMKNDSEKVTFLIGTKSGKELHGLPSNALLFDDEPELFRD